LLRAGRFRDRIPVGARFSAPVQTGPGTHPASCTMGTGSFLGVKSSQGVTLTPHSFPVPRSRKGKAIPVLSLWAIRPVQSLSACTKVHFTFFFYTKLRKLQWHTCHYVLFSQFRCLKKAMSKLTFFCLNAASFTLHEDLYTVVAGDIDFPWKICYAALNIFV